MTTRQLLKELKDTYLQVRPSLLHGIGVFAIRRIPKGFRSMFSKDNGEWTKIPKSSIKELPLSSQRLVENYCTYDDKYYYIEKTGFKKMDLVNFVNHSDNPNIGPVNNGEYFEALRDIKPGEELFIDYGQITG
jgi:SET domain-containing protein